MKIITLFLAFYVLFLAVLPAPGTIYSVNNTNKCQKKCPHAGQPEKQKDGKDNGCSKTNCTPFFGCSKMQIVFTKTTSSNIVPVKFKKFILAPVCTVSSFIEVPCLTPKTA